MTLQTASTVLLSLVATFVVLATGAITVGETVAEQCNGDLAVEHSVAEVVYYAWPEGWSVENDDIGHVIIRRERACNDAGFNIVEHGHWEPALAFDLSSRRWAFVATRPERGERAKADAVIEFRERNGVKWFPRVPRAAYATVLLSLLCLAGVILSIARLVRGLLTPKERPVIGLETDGGASAAGGGPYRSAWFVARRAILGLPRASSAALQLLAESRRVAMLAIVAAIVAVGVRIALGDVQARRTSPETFEGEL